MAGPSKRDREKLRSRVKTELRKLGRSQKDLETSLGLTSGTLTRVFGGRRKLDQELAEGLATELNSTIGELFKATAYLKELDTSGDAAKPAAAKPAPKAAAKPTPKAAAKPAPKAAAKPAPKPAASKPAPKPAAAKPAPKPAAKPAAAKPAPAPAPRAADPVRPSPPPPEEPRFRKRDVPLKVARFVLGLVFGD